MRGRELELRRLDPTTIRFLLLRLLDAFTPTRDFDSAGGRFKGALDTLNHRFNRNYILGDD